MSVRNRILVGDVRERLADIPAASVDCVITSPPYYQLRDYGNDAQLGLEATVDEWADGLRGVLARLGRVLKPTGAVWLNLGDSYSRHAKHGAPSEEPAARPGAVLAQAARRRLDRAQQGRLGEEQPDALKRARPAVEHLGGHLPAHPVGQLLLRPRRHPRSRTARSQRHDAKPRRVGARLPGAGAGAPSWGEHAGGGNRALAELNDRGEVGHPLGKNPGDVWETGTASFRGAHFATFPVKLIERPLLATCPEKVCAGCGRPWQREPMRRLGQLAVRGELRKSCACERGWKPGLVLDPFLGTGTVALAAIAHQRDWLGIELNPDYAAIAEQRIAAATPERVKQDKKAA